MAKFYVVGKLVPLTCSIATITGEAMAATYVNPKEYSADSLKAYLPKEPTQLFDSLKTAQDHSATLPKSESTFSGRNLGEHAIFEVDIDDSNLDYLGISFDEKKIIGAKYLNPLSVTLKFDEEVTTTYQFSRPQTGIRLHTQTSELKVIRPEAEPSQALVRLI